MSELPDNESERLLTDNSLAFFGAITASISHELNNVISIVDQNAGLLEDLLCGFRNGRTIPDEKLARIAETVQRQTQRGLALVRRLNKFAHTVDVPETEFDLNETIVNLGNICTRFAELRKVRLVLPTENARLPITGSPFLLQQYLFRVLTRMLKVSSINDIIKLSLSDDDNMIMVSVEGPLEDYEAEPHERFIDDFLLQRLRATTRYEQQAGGVTMILLLPKKE